MPAAATSTEPFGPPFAQAPWTACWSVVDAPPPRLIEMTFAPCVCAHVMQLDTSEVRPTPAPPRSALQITRLAFGSTPATPVPLFALAVIVPATCVPWRLSSVHSPLTTVPPSASPHATVLPLSSGCVWSMPVSTMPIVVPPVAGKDPSPAASQPSGASMSASGLPPVWPVLFRPYSCGYIGSFGVAVAFRMKFGSA